MTGPGAGRVVAVLKDLKVTHVLSIPDSESRHLHDALAGESGISLITPCREGESVAIAAGLWVGGCKPLLLIQNTGLMEAGDALRGCGLGPKVPLLLIVGWRGYSGAVAGRRPIDSAYTYTEPLLDAWRIPHSHLFSDDDLDNLVEMDRIAASTSRPAAVVTGFSFGP